MVASIFATQQPAFRAVTPYTIYGSDLLWWHDLQDPTTRFSDFIGTPAVAGDRVQLLMDKAPLQGRTLTQELAQQAEKIVNGSGSSGDLTSFVNGGGVTFSVSGGAIQMARSGAIGSYLSLPGTPVGSWVKLSATISKTSGTGSNRVFVGSGSGTVISNGPDVSLFAQIATANLLTIWCDDTTTIALDNVSVKAVPGAHAYQSGISGLRPLLQLGANGAYYLEPDGLDDFMVTSPLDLSSTDKVAVFTAVRKLSDVQIGVLYELSVSSNTNNGSFKALAPNAAAEASVSVSSRGTAANALNQSYTATGLNSPVSLVQTALHDIAGDTSSLRINGTLRGVATGDQGSGNFGSSYPLYYFRRGGSSFPFNGYFWGCFGVKGTPTATQIAQSEALLNRYAQAY